MTEVRYLPFDQDEHLGEPPWKPTDPALVAWEAAHGHDVRLKCYVEFGCQAIENEADMLRDTLDRVRAAVAEMGGQVGHCEWGCNDAIREALAL
jgi:hypothetical protein